MSASRVATRRRRHGRAKDLSEPPEVPFHRGSHRHLLRDPDPATAPPADLDVVIVPTCRPVRYLREAIRLARELDCLLVAMCSRSASPAEAAALGEQLDAEVVAIDTTGLRPAPDLVTTRWPEDRRFARKSDLSLKRNLGLRLARVAGWDRVLFLDDDMYGAGAAAVRAAAGLLRDYPVVGLRNDGQEGYPDNSVVCHAYREVGGDQDTFIGGGAVVVSPARISSFFPDIYNEDWFVFFDAVPVAVTGRVVHKPYDPFASPDRARDEELGDCLAEGLFWALGEESGPDSPAWAGSEQFWRDFLQHRRRFLSHVLEQLRVWDGDPYQRDRMIRSVAAAQRRNSYVTPRACAEYVRHWRTDIDKWQKHLANLPDGRTVTTALTELGLSGRAFRSR